MTSREFTGSMNEVALASTYMAQAKRRLAEAAQRVRSTRGASLAIRTLALCEFHNAKAIAQEWGVAGVER